MLCQQQRCDPELGLVYMNPLTLIQYFLRQLKSEFYMMLTELLPTQIARQARAHKRSCNAITHYIISNWINDVVLFSK